MNEHLVKEINAGGLSIFSQANLMQFVVEHIAYRMCFQ